ncbi:hypothetical protein [Paenibacillus elgii]|uniref:hypothetical protein n=1 Tax=Paenibacillus elgii TaxID=189691 RepID=UPI000248D156|nr:hypothetical protein [Paenibacillus elgii]
MKKTLIALGTTATLLASALVPTASFASDKVKDGMMEGEITLNSYTLEQEPNDTFSNANKVTSDPLGAISSPTDVDIFYLNSRKWSEKITVKLLNIPSGKDYDLIAYNENGVAIAKSTNLSNDEEEVSFKPTTNTKYYFKVYSADGSHSADKYYQIKLWDAY